MVEGGRQWWAMVGGPREEWAVGHLVASAAQAEVTPTAPA